MRRPWLLFLSTTCLLLSTGAQADDFDVEDEDEDFEFEDAPAAEEEPAAEQLTEDDTLDVNEDEDELESFSDPEDTSRDLLEEEPTRSIGGDTEALYRSTQDRLSKMGPDEAQLGWRQYLEQYPNTVFRSRIEARIDELDEALYSFERAEDTEVDALVRELEFSQAMQLENINPRTRLQAAFEWGLPDYMNLMVDYEHAVKRNLSFHGGLRRRYIGWNVEAGARYAIVKSTRTQTLVTAIADLHVNTNPGFPGFRPQLAVGKRFGKVDAQMQGGVDLQVRSPVSTMVVGGASLYYAASDVVGFFGETNLAFRPVSADGAFDGATFQFHVATLGMKFFPTTKSKPGEKPYEVNFGATIPYSQSYWQFHYGSIMAQFNYYL